MLTNISEGKRRRRETNRRRRETKKKKEEGRRRKEKKKREERREKKRAERKEKREEKEKKGGRERKEKGRRKAREEEKRREGERSVLISVSPRAGRGLSAQQCRGAAAHKVRNGSVAPAAGSHGETLGRCRDVAPKQARAFEKGVFLDPPIAG